MVVALAAAGAGTWWLTRKTAPREAPPTFVIRGGLTITEDHTGTDVGTQCRGIDGYADIDRGTQVIIGDADGTTIAVGRLDSGQVGGIGSCRFAFNIANVPEGEAFYAVRIGRRGDLRYSPAEAHQMLELTLT
jgi:hypothetical protein